MSHGQNLCYTSLPVDARPIRWSAEQPAIEGSHWESQSNNCSVALSISQLEIFSDFLERSLYPIDCILLVFLFVSGFPPPRMGRFTREVTVFWVRMYSVRSKIAHASIQIWLDMPFRDMLADMKAGENVWVGARVYQCHQGSSTSPGALDKASPSSGGRGAIALDHCVESWGCASWSCRHYSSGMLAPNALGHRLRFTYSFCQHLCRITPFLRSTRHCSSTQLLDSSILTANDHLLRP